MQFKRFLLILAFLTILIIPCVSAQNVTFSTLGQLGPEDILIYEFNGTQQTLVGQFNTSSAVVPLPESDFNIVVKPSAQARFSNPGLFLSDGISWLETNALSLIVLLFLIGLLWRK